MPVAMKPVSADRSHTNGTAPLAIHRFTLEQYQQMIDIGVLKEGDRVELLEGWIVEKMPQKPRHATTIDQTLDVLRPLLPAGWRLREQKPIVMSDSQPEPDLAVVRGPINRYRRQHPRPADIAQLIEVAETSVEEDREFKGSLYARASIPIYWIINLKESKVEVYTQPKAGKSPGYRQRRDFGMDDSIPVLIDGMEIARVAVRDLLA